MNERICAKVDSPVLQKSENITNFMLWNRDIREQMMSAKFEAIEPESTPIRLIVHGLSANSDYSTLETSWRASEPPSYLSEMEEILTSEEDELERARLADGHMYKLMKRLVK